MTMTKETAVEAGLTRDQIGELLERADALGGYL